MLTDQVVMDIEGEEVKVGVGNVGEEIELQTLIRISQHSRPKKSHIAQVEPEGNLCFFSYFIASLCFARLFI